MAFSNPATKESIHFDQINGSASENEIFDVLGKRIWNEKVNGESFLKFEAGIFQPGLYHFAIVDKNKGIIYKVKIVVK